MAQSADMDENKLIDQLNTLQAQNIALMNLVACVIRQTGLNVADEYEARCAIFRMVTEQKADEDARNIQRETFAKVGRTVLGSRNAVCPE